MKGTDFRHRCTTAECPYLGQLTDNLSCGCHRKEAEIMREKLAAEALAFSMLTTPRPIAEYHEDMGDVLWWRFPIVEPPYVGSPKVLGQQVAVEMPTVGFCTAHVHGDNSPNAMPKKRISHPGAAFMVGGWPGYHTHFTLIPTPKEPT